MLATQPPLITDADLVRAARTPGRWHTCEELSRLTGLSVPRVRAACIAMHRQGYECHPHIRSYHVHGFLFHGSKESKNG